MNGRLQFERCRQTYSHHFFLYPLTKMKLNVIILNGLAAGAFAMPTTNSAVHEKRDVASGPWTKMDAINANARIPVRIALKQRNLENGMAYLMKV